MKTSHTIIIGDSRNLDLINERSIQLIITSPPYWNLKNYGDQEKQIGYFQSYEEYLEDLNKVWLECYRVLEYNCYLCIVVGDIYQRADKKQNIRYKTIPNPDNILRFCENIGFDFITRFVWHKISTTNPSGGCSLMGSIYYPRNPIPTMEHEFILILKKYTPKEFKKEKVKKPSEEIKQLSKVKEDLWFKYVRAYWDIVGIRQKKGHIAEFSLEIPYRLIQMYSFVGETVLDPFVGSGTTLLASKMLNRNSIGYEINKNYLDIIKNKIEYNEDSKKYVFKTIIC